MIFLRSLLYQIFFLSWTLLIGVAYLPLLALATRRQMQKAGAIWLSGAIWLQHILLGLTYEVRGAENLLTESAIIAAKHQSAWETMIFHRLVGDPAFILKKELLFLPLIGWYLQKTGQIAIDRTKGANALKLMVQEGKRAIEDGRCLIIFPEGHRQPPGHTGRYHSGIAKLYDALAVPIVPVALNSGLYWPRNAFLRRSGRIVLQILPAIPPGLERDSLMEALKERIETATRALEQEGLAARQRPQ